MNPAGSAPSAEAPTAAPERRERVRRVRPTVAPRLLDEHQSADYIAASPSYVRSLVSRGLLRRIELPATEGNGWLHRSR